MPPFPAVGGFSPVLAAVLVGVDFPELLVDVVSLDGDLRADALAGEDSLVREPADLAAPGEGAVVGLFGEEPYIER